MLIVGRFRGLMSSARTLASDLADDTLAGMRDELLAVGVRGCSTISTKTPSVQLLCTPRLHKRGPTNPEPRPRAVGQSNDLSHRRIRQPATGVLVDVDASAEIGECALRTGRPVADLAAGPDRDDGARVVERDSGGVDQLVGMNQVAAQTDCEVLCWPRYPCPSGGVVLASQKYERPSGIWATWVTIRPGWANASCTTHNGQLPPTRLK